MKIVRAPKKHKFIRTPLKLLNILTGGGLAFSTISEIYGGNGSGKSSMSYSTASMFLQDNKNAFVTILDCEGSIDYTRFKHTFGIDLERTIVESPPHLEDCFEYISNIIRYSQNQLSSKIYFEDVLLYKDSDLKTLCTKNKIELEYEDEDGNKEKKTKDFLIKELLYTGIIRYKDSLTSHLIIWDSIAASRTKTAVEKLIVEGESGLNSGGMNEKPRLITDKMNIIMSNIVNKPISIIVLNQVSLTGFGTFMGPKEGSSGGNALKHVAHYRLYFQNQKSVMSENNRDVIGTLCKVTIEKAKFCPKGGVRTQLYVNDRLGGKIDENFELPLVAKELELLVSSGAWWSFVDDNGKKIGINYRWSKGENDTSGKYIEGNPEAIRICSEKIARYYRKNYLTVDENYKMFEIELGDENIDKRCFPNNTNTPSENSDEKEESIETNLKEISIDC